MKKFNEVFEINFFKLSAAILLIGVGAGFFSYLLHIAVSFISDKAGTDIKFTIKTMIVSFCFVLISSLLTKYLFKDTNGSGIPQVKLSLAAYKGKMPRRMPFGKFFTTLLTLCSGLSFGKEGPMVTIAASWAHLVAHLFKFNRQITKVLVTSGAAGGLSAAFNTPIAAVVFTIEEILGQLNTKYLGPIIVTSVIASLTSYKLLGNTTTFITLGHKFNIEWHLILYLLLGLTMSIIGFLFVNSVLRIKDIKRKYFVGNEYLFLMFVVLITGFFSMYSVDVLGDGVDVINRYLGGVLDETLISIGILFLLKFILATTAYSTGLSGGLFMPVLFLGAIGGGGFGLCLQHLGVEGIDIGVFALLGMTSLLVAVIRAPFTAFVMLFEMTRDYELILPLMVSSIGAYWISSILSHESVYESVSEYEGVHLPTPNDHECLNEMTVEECMIRDVIVFQGTDSVKDILPIVDSTSYGGFPVVRNSQLIGVVNRCEVKDKFAEDPDCKLRNAAKYSVITIYPDQSLLVALDKMKRFEIGRLPVVSRFNDKQLLGIITPKDIVNYLGLSKQEGS